MLICNCLDKGNEEEDIKDEIEQWFSKSFRIIIS